MTAKKAAASPAPPKTLAPKKVERRKNISVVSTEATQYVEIAKTLTRPEVLAAATIDSWQYDTHDVNDLADELARTVAATQSGDLGRAEAMLISQAQTLDTIFNNLMRRSVNQKMMAHWDAYMRMGMRAQNQCRMTLATLGELKNPAPVAFVKQANISHGPQQVNNNAGDASNPSLSHSRRPRTHGDEAQPAPTKLLEASDGGWLAVAAQGATGRAQPTVGAVEAVDGTDNQSGKGDRRTESSDRGIPPDPLTTFARTAREALPIGSDKCK